MKTAYLCSIWWLIGIGEQNAADKDFRIFDTKNEAVDYAIEMMGEYAEAGYVVTKNDTQSIRMTKESVSNVWIFVSKTITW